MLRGTSISGAAEKRGLIKVAREAEGKPKESHGQRGREWAALLDVTQELVR